MQYSILSDHEKNTFVAVWARSRLVNGLCGYCLFLEQSDASDTDEHFSETEVNPDNVVLVPGRTSETRDGEFRAHAGSARAFIESASWGPIINALSLIVKPEEIDPIFYFSNQLTQERRELIVNWFYANDIARVIVASNYFTTISVGSTPQSKMITTWEIGSNHPGTTAMMEVFNVSNPLFTLGRDGIKLIPITKIEARNRFDVRYKVWRELFINYAVNDIANVDFRPRHLLKINWFIISDSDAELFSTKSMRERFAESEQAKGIVQALSGRMPRRHDIADAMTAAEMSADSVVLSSKALCMTISRATGTWDQKLMNIIADPKYISLCTILILGLSHRQAGFIHADPHPGNIILFSPAQHIGNKPLVLSCKYITRKRAYIVDNTKPSSIIDFSRSIINPNVFPKNYLCAREVINQEQIELIARLIRANVDDPEPIINGLRRRFDENFDRAFEIAGLIDVVAHLYTVRKMYENFGARSAAIGEFIAFTAVGEKIALGRLRELSATPIDDESAGKLRNPAFELVDELFADLPELPEEGRYVYFTLNENSPVMKYNGDLPLAIVCDDD